MTSASEFDYIVVGAGSAGCVLAARLSARPDVSVLLLEAGGSDWNPLFRVPIMTGTLLRQRYANWFYFTEPEAGLDGRRIFWPRGKVLGGSSSINGMVYTRGLPADYDSWAQAGMPGWSFDRVLPYFRRSEGSDRGAGDFHGADGPLKVSRARGDNPLYDAFVAAGVAAGFPRSADFNGPQPEGFGRYDFTIAGGQRWSSARAFLDPARTRPNLTIVTRAHALKIAIEGRRAAGVAALVGGAPATFRARREVVLAAGTVNSPALLMHSGVGDGDVLRPLGIPVVLDRKAVGRNLQDHLLVRVEHACTEPVTLYSFLRPDRAVLSLVQALLLKSGQATSFPIEAGAFIRSDPALDMPDLQSHFLPGLSTMTLRLPFLRKPALGHRGHGFFANLYQLRPESRGAITIASPDPRVAPVIRPGYLSAPRDLIVLREGVKILRRVFAQAPFDRFRGPELAPGPDVQGDAAIEAWIRRTADTVFHPVGTCRMGTNDDAVVDPQLRVIGIDALRVADASIMPTIPSANTHAPTVMIAEKAADMILGAG
jgi:choline dehydrogenase